MPWEKRTSASVPHAAEAPAVHCICKTMAQARRVGRSFPRRWRVPGIIYLSHSIALGPSPDRCILVLAVLPLPF